MDNAANIRLQQLRLGYRQGAGELCLVDAASLDLRAGELVGLVGKNGTGKSTLLRSICGLQPTLGGQILVGGADIRRLSLNALARQIAVVLTERAGGFNLSVWDAVAAGQVPYTDSFHRLHSQHRAVIEAAIAACGISDYRHKPLSELSDGLFQKTMIAKALAQQTATILLDEPSAFLDYASRHELFLLLKDLCERENKCVLVSSHDLDLLLRYCSKLVILSNRQLELIPVNEALTHPGFMAIAGGFL